MKKIALAFVVCLALGVCCVYAADYSVVVNGNTLESEVKPININGRIMVPLRAIAEALSAQVGWDEESRTVTVAAGGSTASLRIDDTAAVINKEAFTLDVPAQIVDGRTLVPVRFVSEALKADVSWDANANTVIVTTDNMMYSPVISYNFNEESGARVYDGAGSMNGVLCGGARRGAGISGMAAALNGAYQYVTLKSGLVNDFKEITVSTWVYLNKNDKNSRIFDFGSSNEKYMFLTGFSNDETLRFAITNTGNTGEQLVDCKEGFTLTVGEWHHLALTLDGKTGVLYLDGKEVARNGEMTLAPKDLGDFSRCYIGKSQWADPYFNGMVDSFRIYDRVLTADEVGETFKAKS